MTIIPFPKYKKPIIIAETLITAINETNHFIIVTKLLKLHFTTVWHEIFAGVYFREFFRRFTKIKCRKNYLPREKNPRKFTSFLYVTEFQLN